MKNTVQDSPLATQLADELGKGSTRLSLKAEPRYYQLFSALISYVGLRDNEELAIPIRTKNGDGYSDDYYFRKFMGVTPSDNRYPSFEASLAKFDKGLRYDLWRRVGTEDRRITEVQAEIFVCCSTNAHDPRTLKRHLAEFFQDCRIKGVKLSCSEGREEVINTLIAEELVNQPSNQGDQIHLRTSPKKDDLNYYGFQAVKVIERLKEQERLRQFVGCEDKLEDSELLLEPEEECMLACHKGNVELLAAVLDTGFDVNQLLSNGSTPLAIASMQGQYKLLDYLISRGAEIDKAQEGGATPLMLACFSGHEDIAKKLIEVGANCKLEDERQDTALTLASALGHIKCVEVLVGAGVDANEITTTENTALISASQHGRIEIVNFLVNAGADIQHENENGATALTAALFGGHANIVKIICNKFSCGYFELDLACGEGNYSAAAQLIQCGVDVDSKSSDGHTAFYTACARSDIGAAKFLLSQGANIDCETNAGTTPLVIASIMENNSIIEFLVESGANIFKAPSEDASALSYAVIRENYSAVKCLVESMSDCSEANSAIKIAHTFSTIKEHREIEAYLRQRLGES